MQHQNHPDHDLLLIAAHAAGDLDGTERTRAQALVDDCAECAAVHHDLVAIAAAARSLPPLGAAPRDFRITPEQAARLRRGSWIKTVLAPFRGAGSAARPLATAATSLGVAGLLVATLLPALLGGLGGSAASAPERDLGQTSGAGPTAAPAPAAGAPGATADAGPVVRPVSNGGATPGPDAEYSTSKDGTTSPPDVAMAGDATAGPVLNSDSAGRMTADNPPNILLIGSLGLLVLGLALFGLLFAGRRLR